MKVFKIIGIILAVSICVTGVIIGARYMQGEIDTITEEKAFISEELVMTQSMLDQTKEELIVTKDNLKTETNKYKAISRSLEDLKAELETANTTIADLKSDEYSLVYIGNFKLTHYCCETYSHICGTGSGLTATGTTVTAGRTIAVDPSQIPYGTTVYIEGYGFRVAEDCGGAVNGNHIDIAVSTHDQAMSMGTTYGGAWILVRNS